MQQDQLDAILSAMKEALDGINNPSPVVWGCQENVDIVRDLLVGQGVPIDAFVNVGVWVAGFMEARSKGLLKPFPTRAEIIAKKEAADRLAGSPRGNHAETAKQPTLAEAMDKMRDKLKKNFEPKAPAPEPEINWPSELKPYQELSVEDQRRFRALTADQIRHFNKRVAIKQHQDKYGPKPQEV